MNLVKFWRTTLPTTASLLHVLIIKPCLIFLMFFTYCHPIYHGALTYLYGQLPVVCCAVCRQPLPCHATFTLQYPFPPCVCACVCPGK